MNQIQLIIFDMDGLLFDTERPSYQALKHAMKGKGYELTLENYKKTIGTPDRDCDSIFQKIYGKDFLFETLSSDYRKKFDEILENEGLSVKKGAEALLQDIDQKGLKKCIASSSGKKTIERYLKKAGMEASFDFDVSGDEVENGKPNPDIFIEACKRANVKPENAIVIEDSLNGLKAANGANIRCVIVPDLIEPNDEMMNHAFAIVSDLEKVIALVDKANNGA